MVIQWDVVKDRVGKDLAETLMRLGGLSEDQRPGMVEFAADVSQRIAHAIALGKPPSALEEIKNQALAYAELKRLQAVKGQWLVIAGVIETVFGALFTAAWGTAGSATDRDDVVD